MRMSKVKLPPILKDEKPEDVLDYLDELIEGANFKRIKITSKTLHCKLLPDGFVKTPTDVNDWLMREMELINLKVKGLGRKFNFWSHRFSGQEFLNVDFFDVQGGIHSIMFCCGEKHDFDLLSEPQVPDMAEAIHMMRFLIEASKAEFAMRIIPTSAAICQAYQIMRIK
jgi:hypothetical protein